MADSHKKPVKAASHPKSTSQRAQKSCTHNSHIVGVSRKYSTALARLYAYVHCAGREEDYIRLIQTEAP